MKASENDLTKFYKHKEQALLHYRKKERQRNLTIIIIIINSLFTVGEKVVYTQVIMHKLINTNYLQTKRKTKI